MGMDMKEEKLTIVGRIIRNYMQDIYSFEEAIQRLDNIIMNTEVEKIDVITIINKMINDADMIYDYYLIPTSLAEDINRRVLNKLFKLKKYIDTHYAQYINPKNNFVSRTVKRC